MKEEKTLGRRKRPSIEKEEEAKTSSQKFIVSHCKCQNVLHGMKIKSLIIYHLILSFAWEYSRNPPNRDTSLLQTVCIVPGKLFLFFSKFNMDTLLIVQTLSMAPSVSVLTGFDCIVFTLDILRAFKF